MSDNTQLPDWIYNVNLESQGIARKLADGINTRIFVGENTMLSVVKIESNTSGNIHSHVEEQWGFLIEGECTRIQGDEEFKAKAGDFWHTPSGVQHGIRTDSVGAVVLDIFSPPRAEYKNAGEGFGQAQID